MRVLTYDGYEWKVEEVRNGRLEDYYRTIGDGSCATTTAWVGATRSCRRLTPA